MIRKLLRNYIEFWRADSKEMAEGLTFVLLVGGNFLGALVANTAFGVPAKTIVQFVLAHIALYVIGIPIWNVIGTFAFYRYVDTTTVVTHTTREIRNFSLHWWGAVVGSFLIFPLKAIGNVLFLSNTFAERKMQQLIIKPTAKLAPKSREE